MIHGVDFEVTVLKLSPKHERLRKWKLLKKKPCPCCHIPFKPKYRAQKFCCLSCAAKGNNRASVPPIEMGKPYGVVGPEMLRAWSKQV